MSGADFFRELGSTMAEATAKFNVQVFASTHSRECLAAAVEAFDDRDDTLMLHRMHRTDPEAVEVATHARGLPAPARPAVLETSGDIKVGVFVLPDNAAPGMLDDVALTGGEPTRFEAAAAFVVVMATSTSAELPTTADPG